MDRNEDLSITDIVFRSDGRIRRLAFSDSILPSGLILIGSNAAGCALINYLARQAAEMKVVREQTIAVSLVIMHLHFRAPLELHLPPIQQI